jgi:eukaryotic-like serine/threonine-protein kinase
MGASVPGFCETNPIGQWDNSGMPLSSGDRLGPYEIVAPLGAGGMGEVYRARDTRLDRTVVVKVLRLDWAGRPDARQRFEREARAISSLNHPHICALYDVGKQDEIEYLVMEYLEGETLSERLRKGALPFDQVLRYGTQIADGLECAHRQGITHRDLKPANIVLTKKGAKLLDFGLARMAEPAAHASPALDVTTIATRTQLTTEGTIMGTIPYMAPEQLEGQPADVRSEIFSFGAILYEMASGNPAFHGKSQASLIAAILRTEPPPLPESAISTSRAFERTVRKCLAKDPDRRWQTAADLKDELEWIAQTPDAVPLKPASSRRWWIPVGAGLLLLFAATAYWLRPHDAAVRRAAIRFQIQPPENVHWSVSLNNQTIAISPEGGQLAFIGRAMNQAQIWIRSLDSLKARPLTGTDGAYSLFWAGDSRSIVFFAEGKLKKAPIAGGPPQTLSDITESVWRGSSLPNGDLLVNTAYTVFRISPGGIATPLRDKNFFWPEVLPDGEHVLFRRRQSPMTWIQSLQSGPPAQLIPTDSRAEYAPSLDNGEPDYLLYLKGGTLMAHPFNTRRLSVYGEPVAIDQGVPFFDPTGAATFSVSRDGILVYQTGESPSRLVWVDRAGKELSDIAGPGDFFGTPRLSPDEQKVVISQRTPSNGGSDLWLFERGRRGGTRLTFDPGIETQATWSPDGKRIVFSNAQKTAPQLWWKDVTATGSGEAVSPGPFQLATDWSKDGRYILFQTSGGDSDSGVWIMPAEAGVAIPRKPVPLIQEHFPAIGASFSPDGKWIAFMSSESGRFEVYVQAFQGGDSPRVFGERHRISTGGGILPRWRPDGRELFFVSGDNRLMSAAINFEPGFRAAEPAALFRLRSPIATLPVQASGFDVARDGQHFVVAVTDSADSPPLTVVVNWQAGLKK